MRLLELFLSFFQVGMFSFGGGFAAIPLIKDQIVDRHGWLTLAEFTDLITIAEMTPGPIAVNSATFVGIMTAGLPGAIVATLGCILPACLIVSLLAFFYFRYQNLTVIQGILSGLRPAVVALIASAGLTILIMNIWGESIVWSMDAVNWIGLGLFAVAIFLLRKFKTGPLPIIFGSGVVGGILYLLVG